MWSPGRSRDRIDILIVLLVAIGPWIPYLAGSVVLYFGDTFYYFYPLRHTLATALREGYLPDWESTVLSGNPFCANPQGNCYYPLSLWYLLSGFFQAYHWALVSHLALGGTGVYVWLRRRRHAPHVALVVATVFLLGGPTLSMVNRLDKLQSLCWWPWVMVAWDMVAARRRWGMFWLAVTLALQFLAGGVEVWAMAVGAGLVWSLLANSSPADSSDPRSGSREAGARPRAAAGRTGRIVGHARIVLSGVAAVGLALLMTAPQWAGLLELLHWSTRATGVSFARASAMSLAPSDLMGMLLPHLFYDPRTLSYVPAPGSASIPHYFYGLYMGWLPLFALFCALVAVFRKQAWTGEARAAFILIALGLIMAFGRYNPFYETLFALLPPLRAVRFPEKFFSLAAFFMLPAIAVGLERIREPRQWFWLAATGGGITLLTLFGQAVPGSRDAGQLAVGAAESAWTAHLLALMPEVRRLALMLAGAATAGYLVATRPRAALASMALVGVVSLDLWSATWTLNPPLPVGDLAPSPKLAGPVLASAPSPRVHVLPVYQAGPLKYPEDIGPVRSYLWLRKLLYPNTGVLDGLAYADGARALRVMHQTQFFAALKGASLEYQLRAARVAGVDAVVTTEDVPLAPVAESSSGLGTGVALVARDGMGTSEVQAWALKGSAPPAYLVHDCAWFLTPVSASAAVLSGRVDVRETAALVARFSSGVPWDWDAGVPACPGGGGGEDSSAQGSPNERDNGADAHGLEFESVPVKMERGGARKVVSRLYAGTGAVMVLPETWYPGWHARIDDTEVPVLLANGYQQAVVVPAGTHDVVLEFRPRGRGWQFALASVGLGLALGSGLRRRQVAPREPG